MTKLLSINNDLKINKLLKNFLTPEKIYIPFNPKYTLNIKNHEQVLKEQVILTNDKDYIYSTVSGKVNSISEMICDGKKMPCIIIENDYEEKTDKLKPANKKINNISKDELKNILREYNAFKGNLDGETMIINGIDNDPFEFTRSHLINEEIDKLLECIDALYEILDIHKCFFSIKSNDSENVTKLVNYIGTYPNINLKLLPDMYPIGKKEILIKELVSEQKLDKGIVYFTVEDIERIYNVLKRKKPITEKLITFGGNALDKTKVLNTKIGTSFNEILTEEFKLIDDNYDIYINGLLSGYKINTLNAIITVNTQSVFIMKQIKYKEEKCINCGLCVKYCPMNCNPKERIKMDKCINCGLCSYICPAKINLKGNKNE